MRLSSEQFGFILNIVFSKKNMCLLLLKKFSAPILLLLEPLVDFKKNRCKIGCLVCRADLGGGGVCGRSNPPQGFDPLPTQRVPSLKLFQKSIFGRPTLKFF